jgi:hypothetical protein
MTGIGQQLDTIRAFRPGTALDDFLDRTIVHEEAGARMPGAVVGYAILGAVLTSAMGVIGVLLTAAADTEFVRTLNAISWGCVVFGVLLIGNALLLSRARTLASRGAMRAQLIAGAVVPSAVAAVIALDIAAGVAVLWLIGVGLWLAIDGG